MPPSDNPDNDSRPLEICRLEWLVWAIDAARRHRGTPLGSVPDEAAFADADGEDPDPRAGA